jgi:hypothetical protein
LSAFLVGFIDDHLELPAAAGAVLVDPTGKDACRGAERGNLRREAEALSAREKSVETHPATMTHPMLLVGDPRVRPLCPALTCR